jgi:hypothetical protein
VLYHPVVSKSPKKKTLLATCFLLVFHLAYSSSLKMEATHSSKTSVDIYQTTCHYNPDNHPLLHVLINSTFMPCPSQCFPYIRISMLSVCVLAKWCCRWRYSWNWQRMILAFNFTSAVNPPRLWHKFSLLMYFTHENGICET